MRGRPPLIVIDALGINQPGGARTAILYLFDNLFRIRPDWKYIVFVSQKENLYFRYPYVEQIELPISKGILARAVIQLLTQLVVWFRKVDLVHFSKSQGGFLVGAKNVLTLFDVTTLQYPEIHKPIAVWFWRYIQPLIAQKSDAVVTLSQNAAEDISRLLHVPENKIHVIPCASIFNISDLPTIDDFRIIREKYKLPDEYLLFVGVLALKKNLSTLIKALGWLQEHGEKFPPLLIIGPKYKLSDASTIFSLIRSLNLTQRVHYLGPIPDSDLMRIYHRAKIFLFPSIHEGFGIPCLEAMACQTPVLASHASAIPEVVGEAGWLVEEYMSPQAWAESICKLLNDQESRSALVEKGLAQVQKYSWTKSAQSLATLYAKLLNLE